MYNLIYNHKIEQCLNYMQAKFQVEGFQNKRDIRHRYRDFYSAFTGPGNLVVSCLSRQGIQASVEDFRPIYLNFTSNICYPLSHSFIKFSVFVVCWSVIFQHTDC